MIREAHAESVLRGRPLPRLPHATLQDALRAAVSSPEGLAFLDAGGRRTELLFAELHLAARRFAGALLEAGVRRGDRVALILPTAPSFPVAFFGALFAGAVPVPLYPPVRLGRLDEYHRRTAGLCRAVGARLILSDARIRRLLGEVAARARPELGCRAVDELAETSPGEEEVPAAAHDLALIQFSSGSTVEPKPVALSHRNVLSNLEAIDAYVPGDGARQAGVSWLPLYHDMGLVGCLLLAVRHPGPLALIPPELFLARPAVWLRAVSAERATLSAAPSFAYSLCARRIRDEELEGVDLSCWRMALNGAEPIAVAAAERFAARFSRWGFDPSALMPVYGLSEATLAVTFREPGGGLGAVEREGRRLVPVGRPVPGAEVAVVGGTGSPLPAGATGRILVRGPAVTGGYFGGAAPSPHVPTALGEGWLDTGDLGFVEAGELFVSGRAKDVIVVRGRNHPPQLFEEALDGIEGLRTGCAVAIAVEGPDGEEPAILAEVAVRTGGPPPTAPSLLARLPFVPAGARGVDERALEERVRAAVLEATGIRPGIVRLLAPGTLPRTSSGKLRRAEARRLFQEGALAPPARVGPLRLAVALLRSQLAHARSKPWR